MNQVIGNFILVIVFLIIVSGLWLQLYHVLHWSLQILLIGLTVAAIIIINSIDKNQID